MKPHKVKLTALVLLLLIGALLWYHKETGWFSSPPKNNNRLVLANVPRPQLAPVPTPLPPINVPAPITLVTQKTPTTTTTPKKATYTLQLIGSHHKKALHAFITKHHLEKSAKIVKTEYQGRPWYVVIDGQYDTSQEANLAKRTLPPDLQQFHPWVRPLPRSAAH